MKIYYIISLIGFMLLGGILAYLYQANISQKNYEKFKNIKTQKIIETQKKSVSSKAVVLKKAYFAGGCFWCTEADFEKLDGVIEVISGYAGGNEKNPEYKQVASGITGHIESIEVIYDSNKVGYKKLVEYLFQHMDPTDAGGSFYDRGYQYTSAIFYQNDEELKISNEVIKVLEDKKIFPKKIKTELLKFKSFWKAEDYHQDYYIKNPIRYKYYRNGSGRDKYLKSIWENVESPFENSEKRFFVPQNDKPVNRKNSEEKNPLNHLYQGNLKEKYKLTSQEIAERRKKLSKLAYNVIVEEGTERPFSNLYDNNKKEGIYVDVISGEPLFSSTHKFDSGTGWPSFYDLIEPENIIEKEDRKLFSTRTEIRSKNGDSHLGHLFLDGPAEKGGKRYCMNSAALKFIPVENLEKEGYQKFLNLFEK